MLVSAKALQTHINYTAWASQTLVEAAGCLSHEELTRDFGTADKSVLGTLVHIFAADRIWLMRLKGDLPHAYVTDADYDLAVLRSDWPALHRRWKAWIAEQTDETAHVDVSYLDMSENAWRQPLWQLVLHVVNHASHHRGQVAGFLRIMQRVPPKLDLVHYYRIGES